VGVSCDILQTVEKSINSAGNYQKCIILQTDGVHRTSGAVFHDSQNTVDAFQPFSALLMLLSAVHNTVGV